MVVTDLFDRHADILEDLEQLSSEVAKSHSAVVRIILLDQHMAVEASHLGDREHADAAEGPRSYGKDLALSYIRAELRIGSGLQAEEM